VVVLRYHIYHYLGIVALCFLSDAVLLLRFNFVKELVVIQVKDPVVLDQDLHEAEASLYFGKYFEIFFNEQGHFDFLLFVFGISYHFNNLGIEADLGICLRVGILGKAGEIWTL
jgi:hypothetical protein